MADVQIQEGHPDKVVGPSSFEVSILLRSSAESLFACLADPKKCPKAHASKLPVQLF